MDRRVTPPKRVTSPIWGTPPPCKQALIQRETSRNFLVTRFMEGMSYVLSFTVFSLPLIFTLHWWPLAFLIFSPQLQNFHVVLPTKTCLLCFFISRSKSLSPFFSMSFAGLPPAFSFSLSFPFSIFHIYGHDIYSNINTLDKTDTETFSVFVFSCLWFTRRGCLCDFPTK